MLTPGRYPVQKICPPRKNGVIELYLESYQTWGYCMKDCIDEDRSLLDDFDFVQSLVRISHAESDVRYAAKTSTETVSEWIPVLNEELKSCNGGVNEKLECLADKIEETFPEAD